ncbi:MAG TPA: amidohydrolase family protein [Candidatus Acidoferrales bacterium]|nr:amidohydrolase family protein [Candidatus Acidoferrales bacterium]
MITRRKLLCASLAAGASAMLRPKFVRAKASQPSTPVDFEVPSGACDCHTHIFGDARQYPWFSGRTYTPESASVAEMRALHKALHIDRVVIVNPSVYGPDNSCTLDAVKQLGPRARAVAVIDDKTSAVQLDEMAHRGVRGIRLNFENFGQTNPDAARKAFDRAVERVAPHKWHIQIYTRLLVIEGLHMQIMAAPVPVVLDHFGGAKASLGTGQPGFDTMLDLVRSGKAYVKISGAYRSSDKPPDYSDVVPLAKALIAANSDRIVWGSDWPHPTGGALPGHTASDLAPLLQIDDGRLLNQLPVWAPDAGVRKKILVENPARLYGFGS